VTVANTGQPQAYSYHHHYPARTRSPRLVIWGKQRRHKRTTTCDGMKAVFHLSPRPSVTRKSPFHPENAGGPTGIVSWELWQRIFSFQFNRHVRNKLISQLSRDPSVRPSLVYQKPSASSLVLTTFTHRLRNLPRRRVPLSISPVGPAIYNPTRS
jgi:hypothetical protein